MAACGVPVADAARMRSMMDQSSSSSNGGGGGAAGEPSAMMADGNGGGGGYGATVEHYQALWPATLEAKRRLIDTSRPVGYEAEEDDRREVGRRSAWQVAGTTALLMTASVVMASYFITDGAASSSSGPRGGASAESGGGAVVSSADAPGVSVDAVTDIVASVIASASSSASAAPADGDSAVAAAAAASATAASATDATIGGFVAAGADGRAGTGGGGGGGGALPSSVIDASYRARIDSAWLASDVDRDDVSGTPYDLPTRSAPRAHRAISSRRVRILSRRHPRVIASGRIVAPSFETRRPLRPHSPSHRPPRRWSRARSMPTDSPDPSPNPTPRPSISPVPTKKPTTPIPTRAAPTPNPSVSHAPTVSPYPTVSFRPTFKPTSNGANVNDDAINGGDCPAALFAQDLGWQSKILGLAWCVTSLVVVPSFCSPCLSWARLSSCRRRVVARSGRRRRVEHRG